MLRFYLVKRSLLVTARYLITLIAFVAAIVLVLLAARATDLASDGGLAVLAAIRTAYVPAVLLAFLPALFSVLRDTSKTAVTLLFLTIIVSLTMLAGPTIISRFPVLPAPASQEPEGQFYPVPDGRAYETTIGENGVYVLYDAGEAPRFAVGNEHIPMESVTSDTRALPIVRHLNALGVLLYAQESGIGPVLVALALSLSLIGLWFFARSTESPLVNLTLVLLALRGIVFLANLVQEEVVAEIVTILSTGEFQTDYIAAVTFGILGLLLLGANALRRPPTIGLGEGSSP